MPENTVLGDLWESVLNTKFRLLLNGIIAINLISCAGVREEDTNAWIGQPLSALELHPFFVTLPVVKTRASDGTEIWNYANGPNLTSCYRGEIRDNYLTSESYAQFTSCMSNFPACNNLFYIRNETVLRYVPTGTGGMRCFTMEELQPQFRGSANF